MLCLLLGVGAVGLGALWALFGDADFTTLFVHWFCGSNREKYRGRVIWITGASSGIGEEVAYIFARLGCRLVLTGTNRENLNKVCRKCEQMNDQCEIFVVPMNIAETSIHREKFQEVIDKFGVIDVLVNNAGRSQRSEFTKIPEEVERELFDVNVFGMISLTRIIVDHWLTGNHKFAEIIVTSSTAGKIGSPFSASYSASKHALHGFFEALRSEVQINEAPIKITIACPGPVRSNIRVTAYTDKVGETLKQPDTDHQRLMATDRCAQLMVSGLAGGLDELWMAPQPMLLLYYFAQYTPSFYRRVLLKYIMTKKLVDKFREGK